MAYLEGLSQAELIGGRFHQVPSGLAKLLAPLCFLFPPFSALSRPAGNSNLPEPVGIRSQALDGTGLLVEEGKDTNTF